MQVEVTTPKRRALTMLNEMGDTTITWSEDRDDVMEQVIQKRMDAGCSFFIIDTRFGTRKPLKKAADANKYRLLAIPDEDFAKFVGDGTIELVKTPEQPATIKRKAKTAKEVSQSESIGVAPRRGG